jgi:hypothetical protein
MNVGLAIGMVVVGFIIIALITQRDQNRKK